MKKGKPGQTTFFIGGQTPVTPNDTSQPITFCRGFVDKAGERHDCHKILVAKMGVLQPRCPDCYRDHISGAYPGRK